MFSVLPTALRIAIRRLNGNRRLMAAVAIGVILAVALMSSTVIYRDALRQLGLQTDLSRVSDQELDVRVLNSAHGIARGLADDSFETIDRRLRIPGAYLDDKIESLTSATFFMTEVGEFPPEEDPRDRARVLYFEGVTDKVELIEGRWPDEGGVATTAEPPTIEVAIGRLAAAKGGFVLGTRRAIHPSWQDDIAPIVIEVVGIVTPIDYTERYWGVRRDHFQVPTAVTDAYSFFAPRATLIDTMAGYLPTLRARLEVLAMVDRQAFTSDLSANAALRFRGAFEAIGKEIDRTRVETEVVNTLDAYATKEFFSSIPLLVLTLQIVGIVLFYLVLVSTMVVERQSAEVALLKSRGAGMWHIMTISALEGMLLVALALGLGPLVAREAIGLLGFSPAFHGLTGGARLTVALSGETYLWAAGGALLSLVALLWPAWRSNRANVVHYVRSTSRPQDRPAFQRYYLDLVVVAVGALLFFQLQDSGSLVTEDLFGGLDQDPLLLIAPAVFVVTVAVVFLRLFPTLLSVFAWIARQIGGASMQVVLWHLTRAPVQPGRLALLLIMATSLGMFGGTFGATLDRSFDDRAAYESGAALRLAEIRSSGASAQMLAEDLADAPGIEAMSQVVRVNGSYTRGVLDVTDATVLAVERESFSEVLWYRDDFAFDEIDDLLALLEAPEVDIEPPIVPADARFVGLWIWLPEARGALSPSVRVKNSLGRYRDLKLAGLPRGRGFGGGAIEPGWRFLVGDLHNGPGGDESGPWEVVAIGVRPSGFSAFSGEIIYDELQYSAGGDVPENWIEEGFRDGIVIEGFETQGRWTVFSDILREPLPDDARLDGANVRGGELAMRYRWSRDIRAGVPRGVRLVGPERPLPVVVSNDFLTEAGLELGSLAKIGVANIFVPVKIVGSFDLFPTWDPARGRSLLLADRDYLDYRVNRNPTSGGALAPTEVWVRPTDEAGLQDLRSYLALSPPWLHTPWDVEAIRTEQNEDPLIAAGWEGLLFITFIAIVLLSALGFLVASVLVAQQQQGEFAVLRTMGFSTRQVLITVGLEKLLIIFVSMAIGTLLGLQLGVMMLEFVGFVETGEALLPPFVTVTDWATIGGAYGVLGLVFLGAIAIIVGLYMRMAIGQILRIGTE